MFPVNRNGDLSMTPASAVGCNVSTFQMLGLSPQPCGAGLLYSVLQVKSEDTCIMTNEATLLVPMGSVCELSTIPKEGHKGKLIRSSILFLELRTHKGMLNTYIKLCSSCKAMHALIYSPNLVAEKV